MRKTLLLVLITLSLWANGQNGTVLNLANNNNYSSFSLFDTLKLENYNLFFTGEDHRFALSNSDLELKMFKYLHKTQGVRVFMIEFGSGMSYFINKYISDADSASKQILKENLQAAYFKLFTKLQQFYDTLPSEAKFTVKGIDIEREPMYAVKYLEQLIPEKRKYTHDSIKIHLDAIKAVSEYYSDRRNDWERGEIDGGFRITNKEFISPYLTLEDVIRNFDRNKEKYALLLQGDYTSFSTAIGWLKDFFYWRSMQNTAQMYLYRESYMEDNIVALFNANPNTKAYGQFGRCHTSTNREKEECSYYYFNALATRLNNGRHPKLKDKVFSCPVFYPNSSSFRTETTIDKGLKQLASRTEKNEVTAYSLDTTVFPKQKKLAKRFSAIIINNLTRDKSQDGTIKSESYIENTYSYSNWVERLLILAEGGVKGYDFKAVNSAFGTNYNSLQQFVGFSIGYAENDGLNVRSAFHWFPTQESKPNDSTTLTLKGFSTTMRYAKDILKNKKYDLTLGIGYGFERWVNTIDEEFTDESRRDILGNSRTTQYINPAFIMDAGIDFNIHISWVTLGFFGRYQLDFSNRRWRQNNAIVANSPRFSLSAYTFGASLGFNLEL